MEIENNLKNTGIIRKIDELGRFVIPAILRGEFNIKSGDNIKMYLLDDFIIMKKFINKSKQDRKISMKVDELGRVVIPIEIRERLGLAMATPMEIYVEKENIILKKFEPCCVFCKKSKKLIKYKNKPICTGCIRELKKQI